MGGRHRGCSPFDRAAAPAPRIDFGHAAAEGRDLDCGHLSAYRRAPDPNLLTR
jgi:hypothetical protein